ncbi:antitoxin VapB family protein [Candidatus Woesearchaeota archaeon]|nr:antitoxin VapB family protein [Candidatus Pacearchaeota archaeon]MBI4452039.1 antitoxin VapB family protein [Candidatus Woesearchaeota archaeon]
MAKTLMVSNAVYEELKKLKTKEDKSFSEVIVELISKKEKKTGRDLWKHFGVLKGDKEYGRLRKEVNAGWRRWQKRYA